MLQLYAPTSTHHSGKSFPAKAASVGKDVKDGAMPCFLPIGPLGPTLAPPGRPPSSRGAAAGMATGDGRPAKKRVSSPNFAF